MSSCLACEEGYYCESGQDAYETNECPEGHYCQASTFFEVHYPCGIGTYNADPLGADESTVCIDCESTKFCSLFGMDTHTGDCPPGFYCEAGLEYPSPVDSSNGQMCVPGTYCPGDTDVPTDCDENYFCDKYGQDSTDTVNNLCSDGFICDTGLSVGTPEDIDEGVSDFCPKGSWCQGGDPTECLAGTYMPSEEKGQDGINDCIQCPYGNFYNFLLLNLIGMYCATDGLDAPTGPCDPG